MNHLTSLMGADDVVLNAADEVPWLFGDVSAPQLDVAGPTARVATILPLATMVRTASAEPAITLNISLPTREGSPMVLSAGSVRADPIDCALPCGDHVDRTR